VQFLQDPIGWLTIFSLASVLFVIAKRLLWPRASDDDDLRRRLDGVTAKRAHIQHVIDEKQNRRRKKFEERYGEVEE
jgi:hypothetical protein